MRTIARKLSSIFMPRSIVGWFILCWSLFLIAALMVGGMFVSFYQQTTTERLRRADVAVARGCAVIADRYRFFTTGMSSVPAIDITDPTVIAGLTAAVT